MYYNLIFVVLVLSNVLFYIKTQDTESYNPKNEVAYFQKLVNHRHSDMLTAIKQTVLPQDYSRQFQMLTQIFTKLFDILATQRVILESHGSIPEGELYQEIKAKESLGLLVENIVFFSEMVLRLPEISHKLLNTNKSWQEVGGWAINFYSQSQLADVKQKKLLNLVSQELGIIPKDPDYVNPHYKPQKGLDQNEAPAPKPAKKIRKKLKRGPQLAGGVRHTEL